MYSDVLNPKKDVVTVVSSATAIPFWFEVVACCDFSRQQKL